MAQTGFQLQNWGRASAGANEPIEILQNGTVANTFREYAYTSPVDTQATVAAAGYFNAVGSDLVTGDLIRVYSITENTYVTYKATSTQGVDPTAAPVITLSATSNGGGYNYLQVPLTLAQINALYDTPVLLIPAPLSTQMIVVNKFTLNAIYGSAAWTNGGVIAPQWGNTVHGGGVNTCTATIAASFLTGISANQAISLTGLVASTVTSSMLGLGVYLSNATADFATGTGGSALANIWYSVVAGS